MRKVLVAAAWPYVNGSLHLGHVAALLPADVIARYHRAKGDDVLFVSGSDCHGTPILVTADREGTTPLEVATRYHEEFVEMLIKRLKFSYTLYSKTMGEFHRQVAREVFAALHAQGNMVPKEEEHAYCEKCVRFLPDRFIEGTCPHCGADRARGDQCDSCGRLTTPQDLKQPRCRTCGVAPISRLSTHLYFRLPAFQERLTAWVAKQSGWRENAFTVTKAWLKRGLEERPVTRDLAWGIPVPVEGFTEKCIYVWFEAVCGYLSCSREWAAGAGRPEAWREWWENPDAIHYYVHGKDNIPFHTIIWPAMLMGLGLHLPDRTVSSEFLNFEGIKFSKSEGIGVWLPQVLGRFEPDAVRFYLIASGPETSDAAFRWQDFQQRVNAELIGVLGNFWNRTFAMTHRYFGSVPEAAATDAEGIALTEASTAAFGAVGGALERAELRQALNGLLNLARKANGYLERREPWKRIGGDRSHVAETLAVCCVVADTLRRLAGPFLPTTVEKLNAYLGITDDRWLFQPLAAGHRMDAPTALVQKIDPSLIEEATKA